MAAPTRYIDTRPFMGAVDRCVPGSGHNVRRGSFHSTLRRNRGGATRSGISRCGNQILGDAANLATTPRGCSICKNFAGHEARVGSPDTLRRDSPWCWVVCNRCLHRRPVAFVPLIRSGPNASSNLLRHSTRCTECGGKGATTAALLLGRFGPRVGAIPGEQLGLALLPPD
jgi:hypothetical protein